MILSAFVRTRTAPGMDGTLSLIFAITETITEIKKFIERHKIIFKNCVKFLNLKDLAQKLTLSRPSVLQTQNGCHFPSFGATKTFLKSQKTRKIISGVCFTSFGSHVNRF